MTAFLLKKMYRLKKSIKNTSKYTHTHTHHTRTQTQSTYMKKIEEMKQNLQKNTEILKSFPFPLPFTALTITYRLLITAYRILAFRARVIAAVVVIVIVLIIVIIDCRLSNHLLAS